jgi:PilZ domain
MIRQMVSMELRNRVRYRLAADAVFAWHGSQGNRLLGEGTTRDISVSGAFIFTRMCPPIGATLELEIFLSRAGGSARTVEIKAAATVIRVEHQPNCEGFAAISKDFTLLFDKNTEDAFGISGVNDE